MLDTAPPPTAAPAGGLVGRRPRAILFDAGLTLIHPSGAIMVEELARSGVAFQVTPEQTVTALVLAAEARHLRLPRGMAGTEKVAATWANLLNIDCEAARRAFHAAAARPDFYCELDPGVLPTLTALRERGITLGVISNSEGTVRDDLDAFGLLPFFATVVDSTIVGIEKPAPGIFQHALAELGLGGSDCWYVGDGLVNDVLGARGAGIPEGVLFDRFDCFAHLPAVRRIRQLEELVGLVDLAEPSDDGPNGYAAHPEGALHGCR